MHEITALDTKSLRNEIHWHTPETSCMRAVYQAWENILPGPVKVIKVW